MSRNFKRYFKGRTGWREELGMIECRQLHGRAHLVSGEAVKLGRRRHDDAIGAESDIGARHREPSITTRNWLSRYP